MSLWEPVLSGAAMGLATELFRDKPKADYTHLQKGIQWRVEDAKRAGIHPLYALGASTSSPVYTYEGGPAFAAGAIKGVSEAVGNITASKREAQLHDLTLREIESRIKANEATAAKDYADSLYSMSNAARVGQASNAVQDAVLVGPQGQVFQTSRSTNQQTVEDEYGGIVGELYGVYRALSDLVVNRTKAGKRNEAARKRIMRQNQNQYRSK